MTRIRGDNGKFVQKSNEPRPVRSIRATDSVWEILGSIANERCITRADLIEYFALNHVLHEDLEQENEKLKGEMAVLRLQLSEVESRFSASCESTSQDLGDKQEVASCQLKLVDEDSSLNTKKDLTYNELLSRAKEALRDHALISTKIRYGAVNVVARIFGVDKSEFTLK